MLTKCVNCGFYVKQTDEFCLNCGKQYPTKDVYEKVKFRLMLYRIFQSKVFKLFLSALVTYIFIDLLADFAASKFIQFGSYIWLFAFILWVFLLIFVFLFLNNLHLSKPVPRIIKNKNNLNSKDKIIENRISELKRRGEKIDSVLDKIKKTDGKSLQEVRQKLLSAREIVISQFARYELQKQKIELVRLQNGVSPYLFGLHRLNEFETENGLVTIENTRHEINKIRQNLTRHDAIDFPGKALPEKQSFLEHLEETENSCQKLREALLSRQAARALQDISPIEENLKLPGAKEIVRESDVFNIQTTLTDFSESFDELEREYRRIKAEEETGQKLLAE